MGARGVLRRSVEAPAARCTRLPCRCRWLGFLRGAHPRAVPPLPAGDLRRGHRAGPRHRAAAAGAAQRPGQPRLPVLRPARLRQDHQRPHPGPRAQLRAGRRSPTRAASASPAATWRAAAPGQPRRHRDRRGLPRRRRRRPRPARARVLRAGHRRYKIYIVDEAHMVSTQGFNALLKLVEEPPEHVKFIFATTEPEKVIATIRSRTHHYPFRLVPPRALLGVPRRAVRRGGRPDRPRGAAARRPRRRRLGPRLALRARPADRRRRSRRASPTTCAAGLLGYTDDALLDEVVDAFAAPTARPCSPSVDRVIETGQDPRRFTEDLLEPASRPGHRRRRARRRRPPA